MTPAEKKPAQEARAERVWDPTDIMWGTGIRSHWPWGPSPGVYFLHGASERLKEQAWAVLSPSELEKIEKRARSMLLSGHELDEAVHGALRRQHADPSKTEQALSRIDSLLEDIGERLSSLELAVRSTAVSIQTLAPEPYELKRPIGVVVRPSGEAFEASFYDANLHGQGDTEEEAVEDLKAAIVETFESLSSLPEAELGPIPQVQRAVLSDFLRRTEQ